MRENKDYHPKMLNPNDFRKGDPNSQVLHSSPSIVSEPPDIKNWFSSYTYQSPILETNELFGNSSEVDEEELGLYVEDSEIEDGENLEDLTRVRTFNQYGLQDRTTRPIICKSSEEPRNHDANPSPVEVHVYPDSLSHLSEPPDIKNWFSSYVYESPTLDSTDFDISLLSNNDFRNVQEFDEVKAQSYECKETNLIQSAGLVRIDSNKTHRACQDKEGSEKIDSDKGADKEALQIADIIADKLDEFSREKNESPLPTTFQNSNPTSTSNEDTIFSEKCKIMAENDFGWILPTNKSRKTLSESRKIEDGSFLAKENEGYSPLKKNKTGNPMKNDENYARSVKREALKETTNNLYNSSTIENVGKWKCPQKSKPNIGPPLKQLRLGRWVHRI